MSPRYRVTLTEQERSELDALTKRGKISARKFVHARALLLCDAGAGGPAWKVADAAEALGITSRTIEHIKKQFVEEGLEAALDRKPLKKPPRKIEFDGAFEARLIALACSDAPDGRARWTVRLLADKVVELEIAESVSQMTVQRILKKTNLNLTSASTEKSRRKGAPHLPYDPCYPVICMDESSKQLIGEVREPVPCAPGRVARMGGAYVRNGVAEIFMEVEPLSGKRHVAITERRTRKDWASQIKEMLDERYPDAVKVRWVMDNLNTHSIASLCEAFDPKEARRLAERLDIHYTPQHGSWLNMAEIELSVLKGQCLGRRIDNMESMKTEVVAWEQDRNNSLKKIDWQFTTSDARIRLTRLYPKL